MDDISYVKDIMYKIAEIFSTGDFTEVDSIFATNYIDHQKPDFIQVDGPEEFRQIVNLAIKSLPNLKVSIEDLIVELNKAAARMRWSSINLEGKVVERETLEILRFENGQAVEHWGAKSWSKETSNK